MKTKLLYFKINKAMKKIILLVVLFASCSSKPQQKPIGEQLKKAMYEKKKDTVRLYLDTKISISKINDFINNRAIPSPADKEILEKELGVNLN